MRFEIPPPSQSEQPGDEPNSQPEKQPDTTKKKEILPDPDDVWKIPVWIDPNKEEKLLNPLEEWE